MASSIWGIVYLAGMTADDLSGDTTQQTHDVLAKIDTYLAKAGSDKSRSPERHGMAARHC